MPVPVLGDDEYARVSDGQTPYRPDWPRLAGVVLVDPPEGVHGADVPAFANGRRVITLDPVWAAEPVIEVPNRTLTFYSSFFCLEPRPRAELFSLLEAIRPRRPYRDLARDVGRELGDYNAVHLRRTDHLDGVPAYRRVAPRTISDNLASVFPTGERLVVCTEADPKPDAFVPLRSRFADIVFLSGHVLGKRWGERFAALPRHDDSALALVSQEVATGARRFAGTLASTFTGIIHRVRRLRDPEARFCFTADFLGGPTRFEDCEYRAVRAGAHSWNRLAYPVSPNTQSWMREWPEVAWREDFDPGAVTD